MPARSGQQYVESLRRRTPRIYLEGRRVEDVTAEPLFQGPLRSIAEQYDMQFEPAYREVMTYPSPSTGEPVSTSFVVPRSRDDLVKMRRHFKLRTDHNFGFMGRAPDFMNCFVTGLHQGARLFARQDERYGANATAYYEHVRERDLFLTHMLINPQIDRSKTSAQQEEPFLHLGRAGETAEGMVVRGAKMLGTMAPLAEEVVIVPFGGMAPGDDAYAVAFAVPIDAPGLRFICRETVAPLPRVHADHPLSSRFEEMDCIAVFDDVLVPWERVFIDGRPGSVEQANRLAGDMAGAIGVQTAARIVSQMEFFCGLALKLADAIGIAGFLHVQEKLGELLTHLEMARAVFYGAEALAFERPDGVWMASPTGLRALHIRYAALHARFVEVVQILAGGGFFYAPSAAEMANPEVRADIDRFVRGRPGVSAEERVRLFKLAWDATGEAFAQRVAQYARFYSGDPIRLTAGFYLAYDQAPLLAIVDRALAGPDGVPVPLSPETPGAPSGHRPPPGVLTGAYPAASHPAPRRD